MNDETNETHVPSWEESHPWLSSVSAEDADSLDEVIRYTLDELRLA